METLYGAGVNPAPYMIAAFGLAILIMAGYVLAIFLARGKIRRLMSAMSDSKPNS
jgi:hypothetical protein